MKSNTTKISHLSPFKLAKITKIDTIPILAMKSFRHTTLSYTVEGRLKLTQPFWREMLQDIVERVVSHEP